MRLVFSTLWNADKSSWDQRNITHTFNPYLGSPPRHLAVFTLLLLAQKPMHGGTLLTVFETTLPTLKVDSAGVYRTLQQLEDAGEVESEWDTSSRGSAKRIYHITPSGWAKLDEWYVDIQARIDILNYFAMTYHHLKEGDAQA